MITIFKQCYRVESDSPAACIHTFQYWVSLHVTLMMLHSENSFDTSSSVVIVETTLFISIEGDSGAMSCTTVLSIPVSKKSDSS